MAVIIWVQLKERFERDVSRTCRSGNYVPQRDSGICAAPCFTHTLGRFVPHYWKLRISPRKLLGSSEWLLPWEDGDAMSG